MYNMVKGLSPRRLCIRARSSQTAALAFLSASRTGCFDVNYWLFFFFTFSACEQVKSDDSAKGKRSTWPPVWLKTSFYLKKHRENRNMSPPRILICFRWNVFMFTQQCLWLFCLTVGGSGADSVWLWSDSEGSKRLGRRERDGEGGEGWNWGGKPEAEVKRCDNCLLFVSFSC